MEQTTNDLHMLFVAGLINFLGMFLIAWYNIAHNKKHNAKTSLKKIIAEKVDKEDCIPAMHRVGKEIDRLEKINGKHDNSIHGLEVGMAYLVGKSGGDYNQLKKNGGN